MTATGPQAQKRPQPWRHGPKKGSEAAKRIGQTLRTRYGADYHQKRAKEGGAAVREKYGSNHFAQLGRKGGSRPSPRRRPPDEGEG